MSSVTMHVGPQMFTSLEQTFLCLDVSVKELFLVGLPANCLGVLGSLSCDDEADGTCYTASYAVQPDDSVTFIVSARTPANTWVGLGVSDDRFMVSAAM